MCLAPRHETLSLAIKSASFIMKIGFLAYLPLFNSYSVHDRNFPMEMNEGNKNVFFCMVKMVNIKHSHFK